MMDMKALALLLVILIGECCRQCCSVCPLLYFEACHCRRNKAPLSSWGVPLIQGVSYVFRERLEDIERDKLVMFLRELGLRNRCDAHERSIMKVFQQVIPSIAIIEVKTIKEVTESEGNNARSKINLFSRGSGFLFDNKGHILTNHHVVFGDGQPHRVTVRFSSFTFEAEVVGSDPTRDVAVLKVVNTAKSSLPRPVHVGTSRYLQIGQTCLAIGHPRGLTNTFSKGVISGLGRHWRDSSYYVPGCIQADVSLGNDNSGGPLLDTWGRVIGMPAFRACGLHFAIPIDTVKRIANQIIRDGKATPPTIGLYVIPDKMQRDIENANGRVIRGAPIMSVLPHSPAAEAGLESFILQPDGTLDVRDVIVAVDGKRVYNEGDFQSLLDTKDQGESVSLALSRANDRSHLVSTSISIKVVCEEDLYNASQEFSEVGQAEERF